MALHRVMDELVRVGEELAAQPALLPGGSRLAVLRWRPFQVPSFPCLWHWMTPNPRPEMKDLNRLRDTLTISAYIGTAHRDPATDMEQVEALADAYVQLIDPILLRPRPGPGPLHDAARWAERTGMALTATEFSGTPVLAIEFPMAISIDRQLITSN